MGERVTIIGYYWSAKDTVFNGDKKYTCIVNGTIYVGGDTLEERQLPKNYKSVTLRVLGLTPWVYLEYPKNVSRFDIERELPFIAGKDEILSIKYIHNQTILDKGLKKDLLKINLKSEYAISRLRSKFSYTENRPEKTVKIGGVDIKANTFMIHEEKIDQLVKNAKVNGINFSDYFSIPKKALRKNGFSTSDYSAEINVKDLKAEPEPPYPFLTSFCVIDFEQYSHHHDSTFPDPRDIRNHVFQIGIIHGYLGMPETYKKYLLTRYDPGKMEGIAHTVCKTERELFLLYSKFLSTLKPQMLIHYNGLSYDLNCETIRCEKLQMEADQLKMYSKIKGESATKEKINWSSKAYGESKYNFYDGGWVQVDVKVVIERDYKLPTYALKHVAEVFLKERKMDLTARQMFILVKLNMDYVEFAQKWGDQEVPQKKRLEIKKTIQRLFPPLYNNSVTQPIRKKLLEWTTGTEFLDVLKSAIRKIGEYCLQDCNVTLALCDNRNIWEGFVQLSKVAKVPISYLQGKGTLVKVGAMLFSKCYDKNIVVNSFPVKPYVPYQGAYVVDGVPGYYTNVVTFDFFSLYPTNIILGCLDYSTIDLPTKSEKNVYEWESHENCVHGTKKVVKQKKTICGKQKYSFDRILFDENGKPINEGVLPDLLNEGLDARVKVKFEMAVYETAVKAHEGKLQNPEKDLEFLKANHQKFNIIYNDKKGGLPEGVYRAYKARCSSLNARQLAIKVFLNSVYGGTGAQKGPFPCVPIASSITYMARIMINYTIKKALELFEARGINAKLVYGDTDSCMISLPDLSSADAIALGIEFSDLLTHYVKLFMMGLPEDYTVKDPDGKSWSIKPEKQGGFPRKFLKGLPEKDRQNVLYYDYIRTKLEFEKLYIKFLFLTKKRYIAEMCNTKGVIVERTKKGCALTRRENPGVTKKIYSKLTDMILESRPKKEVFGQLYDMINDLFTAYYLDSKHPNKITLSEFIIYMGIKNQIDYARKAGGRYIDKDGFPFQPSPDPITGDPDPLDPRLVYPKLSQIHLIVKMRERGQPIPSGTRMEFLYIETEPGAPNCEKSEDYTFFKERGREAGLTLDILHYLSSKIANPISELLSIRYRGEVIPYQDPEAKFHELYSRQASILEPEFKRISSLYSRLKGSKTENTWTMEKFELLMKAKETVWLLENQPKLSKKRGESLESAQIVVKKYKPKRTWNLFMSDRDLEKYTSDKSGKLTSRDDQVLKILAVLRLRHEKDYYELEEDEDELSLDVSMSGVFSYQPVIDPTLVEHALKLYSIHVITKRCEQLKGKKYLSYDKNINRADIAMGRKIFSSKKIEHVPTGSIGIIINKRIEEDKSILYTIQFENYGVIENVAREYLNVMRYKDDNFMGDIIEYRTAHKKLVTEFPESFRKIKALKN